MTAEESYNGAIIAIGNPEIRINAVVSTGADVPPYTKVHSCTVFKNPVWE